MPNSSLEFWCPQLHLKDGRQHFVSFTVYFVNDVLDPFVVRRAIGYPESREHGCRAGCRQVRMTGCLHPWYVQIWQLFDRLNSSHPSSIMY